MEEEKTPDIKKEKEKKDFLNTAYLYVNQIIQRREQEEKQTKIEEQEKEEEKKKRISQAVWNERQKITEEELKEVKDAIQRIRASREFIQKVFPTEGMKPEVMELLPKLDLRKASLPHLALAAVSASEEVPSEKEPTFALVADKIHKCKEIPQEKKPICSKANALLQMALVSYAKGDPKPLGLIIAAGVRNACHEFAKTSDRVEAIQWAEHIREILPALEADPALMQASGLKQEELNAANGAVQIGNIYIRGMKAMETIGNAYITNNGISISTDEMVLCTAEITAMELAAYQKDDYYQKWKARPEKETVQELLDSPFLQELGKGNVTARQARYGAISKEQSEIIRDISSSVYLQNLQAKSPAALVKHLMNEDKRKDILKKLIKEKTEQISSLGEKPKEILGKIKDHVPGMHKNS